MKPVLLLFEQNVFVEKQDCASAATSNSLNLATFDFFFFFLLPRLKIHLNVGFIKNNSVIFASYKKGSFRGALTNGKLNGISIININTCPHSERTDKWYHKDKLTRRLGRYVISSKHGQWDENNILTVYRIKGLIWNAQLLTTTECWRESTTREIMRMVVWWIYQCRIKP